MTQSTDAIIKQNKIRVMWLSINASLFNVEKTSGGWTSSLELALREHCENEVELAVLFEGEKQVDTENKFKKTVASDTAYYEISNRNMAQKRNRKKPDAFDKWEYIKPAVLAAIADYKPDIIQCFGSEWPYGMVAEYVDIPVVIHMQGFLNVYSLSMKLLPHAETIKRLLVAPLPKSLKQILRPDNRRDELEAQVMKSNHYFMGRTNWDKRIVKYYSRNSNYYHIPELIRPAFYEAAGSWKGDKGADGSSTFLTVSQASPLKGNEIILHTARIMKDLLKMDFEWRLAGSPEMFSAAEKTTGIKHSDVNIHLMGWITQDQIIEELQNADFFIHPSIIDNSPNAICEAQLIGCPVVASNVGGVPDLIDDGRTGLLYPYNEPHTLAFIIDELKDNSSLLAQISENEAMMAKERHNPKTVAEQVVKVYNEIITDFKKAK